jgi:hypothetical protein
MPTGAFSQLYELLVVMVFSRLAAPDDDPASTT